MSHYVTVSEYAQLKDVHRQTVYRWTKDGNIDVKEINGVLHVKIDDDGDNNDVTLEALMQQNSYLHEEVEYLRGKLDQVQEQAQEDKQRSDTIIMQLTKQIEHHQLMIEDMRTRSVWTRLKTAMGFAGT